jgi:hypothetical protein
VDVDVINTGLEGQGDMHKRDKCTCQMNRNMVIYKQNMQLDMPVYIATYIHMHKIIYMQELERTCMYKLRRRIEYIVRHVYR